MTTPAPLVVVTDTDVFSFMFNNRQEAEPYRPHVVGAIPAVTFVTVGELYAGAYGRNWSQRSIQRLESQLGRFLVLPYNHDVALTWARVQTAVRGRRFPVNDAWIAACAMTFECTLLTHNRRDFEDIPGLRLISYAP